ncbi:hypothetical protein [Latilactobacillus curvatus]|uniref:hypothetical protein n=1 Tax=Latilactobacillus curvatus TaxID=28038 RepID=UPI0024110256|nr:hypothetical protein [Latilactobacillus curvatus]
MKLGIAGTGKVVEQFLPVIAELPEIQVTAINSTPKMRVGQKVSQKNTLPKL